MLAPQTMPGIERFERTYRVRTWLALLVVVCVLPLALFSAALLARNAQIRTQQTDLQVRDRARLLAEDIDRELARVIAAAEVLATADSLATGDLESFFRRAVQVRDLLGTNVLVRDLSSQQLVNTRVAWGAALPKNPVFEVDRRAIENRSPQVSGLLSGAVARAPLLIVVVPVVVKSDVRYLLSLTISLERLQAILSPERLPPGWVAGLVDGDGIVIGRSQKADQFIGSRVRDDLWEMIKSGPEGIHRIVNLEGIEVLQAFSRSRASGWLVGVSVPEALVTASARQTLLLFASGGLFLFLVSMGMAVVLGRRLTRPINQVARMAEGIGTGALVPAPIRGVAEVDVVSEELRKAADLIQKRTADLEAANQDLRRTIAERDLLLGEVYHRVKNNLQVVDSLLTIQMSCLEQKPSDEILSDLRKRVNSMGLIHQQLMLSEDKKTLDICLFLDDLQRNLAEATALKERAITLSVEADRLMVPPDFATPLGLLVTELVSNTLKHAFPDNQHGVVTVTLRRCSEGEVLLRVADNGCAPKDMNVLRGGGRGAGMKIVRALAAQLEGEMTVSNQDGTQIDVRMPFPEAIQ